MVNRDGSGGGCFGFFRRRGLILVIGTREVERAVHGQKDPSLLVLVRGKARGEYLQVRDARSVGNEI
jgi:hypothetical protein